MTANTASITAILNKWQAGDPVSGAELIGVLYDELHDAAARVLRGDAAHTLPPTALVHELYVRLSSKRPERVRDRQHFLAIAAQTLRWILIDHVRARNADRRGGGTLPMPLELTHLSIEHSYDDLLDVSAALDELREADARAASVVEMRFFGGLEEREIAAALDVSLITVKRDWKFARSWIRARIGARPGFSSDESPDSQAERPAR